MNAITFDKSAREFILDTFGKTIDREGFLVEKDNPAQRVLALDGQEIQADRFGGVRKGSEIYIKSDFISLIELFDQLAQKE